GRAERGGQRACGPAWQAWDRRLLDVERRAAQLPVPAPTRKTAFLERLRQAEPAPAVLRFNPARPPTPGAVRERRLQKMAVAVALAPALLLITAGVWLWQRGGPPPTTRPQAPVSLLAERLKGNPRWEKAETPVARLEVLTKLADEVHGKASAIAHTDALDGLDREVRLYQEIVQRITSTE